jgi:hypothetical protein
MSSLEAGYTRRSTNLLFGLILATWLTFQMTACGSHSSANPLPSQTPPVSGPVTPVTVTTSSVTNATVGKAYSLTLQESGGQSPFSWKLASGSSLPAGLSLATNGTIQGNATAPGRAGFSVQLTDAAGSSATATFQMNVFPELPRVTVDTTFPTQNGNVIAVGAGGNLQAAITSAHCGDTIKLAAGATFNAPSTGFVLQNKGCNGTWIVITTDSASLPAAGTRVSPADAVSMPKLVTVYNNVPVIQADLTQAGYYRLVGLEMTLSSAVTTYDAPMVNLGGSDTSVSTVPHHIILDRCYVHGTATSPTRRGVALQGAYQAVIDSYISDFHQVGNDTQAIGGWNGPGPFQISNNYLEAAGENVMTGGTTQPMPGNVPSDITITGNYFFKPLSWKTTDPTYAGIHWEVKNLLELKNAQRVLVDGNVFENNWTDGQVGFAWLCTPRSTGGQVVAARCADITYTHNVVMHVGSLLNADGIDDTDPVPQPLRGYHILVQNNLALDVNNLPLTEPGGSGGDGRGVQVLNRFPNLFVDHNTIFASAAPVMSDATPAPGFVMTNNLLDHGEYGVFVNALGEGSSPMNVAFPGYTFTLNALVNGPPALYPKSNQTCGHVSCFLRSWDAVSLVDVRSCRSGNSPISSCALNPHSHYFHVGTDEKDIGADVTDMLQRTNGVRSRSALKHP